MKAQSATITTFRLREGGLRQLAGHRHRIVQLSLSLLFTGVITLAFGGAARAQYYYGGGHAHRYRGGDDHAETVARGKYLVTLGGCSDCHTPGSFFGKPDVSKYLGGSDVGFSIPGLGVFVGSNLTPDKTTGLGNWTTEQIVIAFTTGKLPDGRTLAPIMPYQALAHLTKPDALAIAYYLQSLPPVYHQVAGPYAATEKANVFVMDVLPAAVYNNLSTAGPPTPASPSPQPASAAAPPAATPAAVAQPSPPAAPVTPSAPVPASGIPPVASSPPAAAPPAPASAAAPATTPAPAPPSK
jgi:hypothetical protein